jgi:hypothetical protein
MGKAIRVLAVVVLLTIAKGAYADEFSFSFSSGPNSASGTLTTDPESGGHFLVTSASGTIDLSGTDYAMTLLAPGTYGDNDNLIYIPAPYLDTFGLGFSAHMLDFNIYYDPVISKYLLCDSAETDCSDIGDGSRVTVGSLTRIVGAMPEPGTFMLLGLGLMGLVMLRRKGSRAFNNSFIS